MSRLLRLLLIAILFCFMVGGFLLLQVSKNLPRETGNELLAGKDQPDPLDKEPAADTSVPAELSEPLAKVGQPEAQGEASDPDFEFLKRMGVGTDSASLIEYLKKHSPENVDSENLEPWIHHLGDTDFAKREEAFNKLSAIGLSALQALRKAEKDPDPEVGRRAHELVAKQEQDIYWGLNHSVVRRLLKLNPPDTLEILLRFLPFAGSEEVVEEIWYGVDRLAVKRGKVATPLLGALQDRSPARRAIAACVVGRVGNPSQKQAALKLLGDSNDLVRLRAAQGLLAGGDNSSVDALIELLGSNSTTIAWQAEELLIWLAGEHSPQVRVESGTTDRRRLSQEAWRKWRSGNPLIKDLWESAKEFRRPGLVLVSEMDGYVTSHIWISGCDGIPRWHMKAGKAIVGLRILNDGHLVTWELSNQEVPQLNKSSYVCHSVVQDLQGSIIRDDILEFLPSKVQFLPNGNVIFFSLDAVVEIDPTGKEIRSYKSLLFNHGDYKPQEVLGNGNLLIVLENEGALLERNRMTNKTESEIRLAERMDIQSIVTVGAADPPGFLIIIPLGIVRHLDRTGEVVKTWPVLEATSAALLRNGNLLAAIGNVSSGRVAEIQPSGRRVWEAVHHFSGWQRFSIVLNLVRFGFESTTSTRLDIDTVANRTHLLESKDPAIRAFSAAMLGHLSREKTGSLSRLISSLGDENDDVRREAFDALFGMVDQSRKPLMNAATSSNTSMRAASIQLLGYCKADQATIVPVLIAALKDKECVVRKNAAFALISFGPTSKPAVPTLINALKDKAIVPGTSESVCEGALRALGAIGREADEAAPAILAILENEDPALRANAARALGTVGSDKIAVDALINLLDKDLPVNIHFAAAGALAIRGPGARQAVDILIRLLDKPRSDHASTQDFMLNIITALGCIGPDSKRGIPLIREKLVNANNPVSVRERAAFALGNIGIPTSDVLEALKVASEDTNPVVRKAALTSLDKLKHGRKNAP